ncbi:hypothetical protein C0991_003501, partial [Blastosporella zonata]
IGLLKEFDRSGIRQQFRAVIIPTLQDLMRSDHKLSSHNVAVVTKAFNKARALEESSINKLPNEILLQIFYFSRTSATLTLPPTKLCVWRLRHVCRRWRQILLGEFHAIYMQLPAGCKEDISIPKLKETLKLAHLVLQNSGRTNISLTLRIDQYSLRLRESALPVTIFLGPNITRVSKLTLTLGWPALRALFALPPGSLACTEALSLRFFSEPKTPEEHQSLIDTRIFEGTQRLRYLRLGDNGHVHYAAQFPRSLPWHQLTNLMFDSPYGSMLNMKSALSILRKCDRVVECFVKYRPNPCDDGVHLKTITLPRVRFFSSFAASPGGSTQPNLLMRYLKLPELTNLWVDGAPSAIVRN